MSRKKTIAFMAVLISALLILVFNHLLVPIALLYFLFFISVVINKKVVRNINIQKDPFKIGGSTRNVDYLIIGDMINPKDYVKDDERYVQIKAPGRNLAASFEILKHTSSILREDNGIVIIAVKSRSAKKEGLSVFDVPFLYHLTVKKYKIEPLQKYANFPFFCHPIASLLLALNIQTPNWKEVKCDNQELLSFCRERNIELIYCEK